MFLKSKNKQALKYPPICVEDREGERGSERKTGRREGIIHSSSHSFCYNCHYI
jgi:hypothetical protein